MTLLEDVPLPVKLLIASITGGGALIADISNQARGWEDLGLKSAMALTIVFVVKLLLDQQKAHKQELKEAWDLHKADAVKREEKLVQTIETQVKSMNEVRDLTREQTDYFKAVTRNIIDERLKTSKRTPP